MLAICADGCACASDVCGEIICQGLRRNWKVALQRRGRQITVTPIMVPFVFDTSYPADSVEFCPNASFTRIFACGTYKLQENQQKTSDGTPVPQKRLGQCLLHELATDGLSSYILALFLIFWSPLDSKLSIGLSFTDSTCLPYSI